MLARVGCRLVVAVLSAGLGAVGCGCGEEWFIRQNQGPGTAPACAVSDDPQAPFRTVGRLDLALRDDYFLTPLVQNDTGDGIHIDGAIVRAWCDAAGGGPDFSEFFSPAPTYVDANGRVGTSLIAIHAGMVEALRAGACCPAGQPCDEQLVLVGVRMTGTSNGESTETAEFQYVVEVCAGCLVACAADADSDEIVGPDCCAEGGPAFTPCFPGQDDPVDCRLCGGSPICACGTGTCS